MGEFLREIGTMWLILGGVPKGGFLRGGRAPVAIIDCASIPVKVSEFM